MPPVAARGTVLPLGIIFSFPHFYFYNFFLHVVEWHKQICPLVLGLQQELTAERPSLSFVHSKCLLA